MDYWHIKICILFKYKICESLVKIQHYRHECSSIRHENTKKHNKIKWHSITYSHIWHINTPKCAYWLDKNSEKVWCKYVVPNTNATGIPLHFLQLSPSPVTVTFLYQIVSDIEKIFYKPIHLWKIPASGKAPNWKFYLSQNALNQSSLNSIPYNMK